MKRCPTCGRTVPLPCLACSADTYAEHGRASREATSLLRKLQFSIPQAICTHGNNVRRHGKDRDGKQRYQCAECGKCFSGRRASLRKPLVDMRITNAMAARALQSIMTGRTGNTVAARLGIKIETISTMMLIVGSGCAAYNSQLGLTVDTISDKNRRLLNHALRYRKTRAHAKAFTDAFIAWDHLSRCSAFSPLAFLHLAGKYASGTGEKNSHEPVDGLLNPSTMSTSNTTS